MFNGYLEIKNINGKKYSNIKNFKILAKVICFLILSTLLIRLLFKYQILMNSIKHLKNEIIQIENYLEICEKDILLNKIIFKKIKNPKISIISAVYNRGNYILRFIRSIQNQFFNDIEIILIDDFSNDNTIEVIEKCQKEDERIILIKHKQNKGTLISRNDGVLFSSGEYLIFPDPDDILSNDILFYCYSKAKDKDYDMIKFNLYAGNKRNILTIIKNMNFQEIYQKNLSFYIFYGEGQLRQLDYSISNKFVKRDIYIKSLNYIDKYYLNQNMIVYEDGLINYMLYKYAKILYITKKVGYYYIQNQ